MAFSFVDHVSVSASVAAIETASNVLICKLSCTIKVAEDAPGVEGSKAVLSFVRTRKIFYPLDTRNMNKHFFDALQFITARHSESMIKDVDDHCGSVGDTDRTGFAAGSQSIH